MGSTLDTCYDHFQRVITELGGPCEGMSVDITRGTKAMSAALLLAAFRHRITRVRYVEGDRDPTNPGVVVPGSERIRDLHADIAFKHRAFDDGRLLFQKGDFAATASLLRNVIPRDDTVQCVARIADFYSAWDRFDYESADSLHFNSPMPSQWQQCIPSQRQRQWVHQLAQPLPDQADPCYKFLMAKRLRWLIVDLLANGKRRVHQCHFEDAILRAYRVLEMLGQARLFDRGFDSANLPQDHTVIQKLQEDRVKKGSAGFGINKDGTLNAAREQVAHILNRLGDPLAQELLNIAEKGTVSIKSRNHSVLVHGYEAIGLCNHEVLNALYEELRQILRQDCANFDENFTIAQFEQLWV